MEADTYVMGVCLDLNGDRPLADDHFDLYPRIPYRLKNQQVSAVMDTVNALLLRYDRIGGAAESNERMSGYESTF